MSRRGNTGANFGRRAYLKTIGAAGTVGLAGCLDQFQGGDGENEVDQVFVSPDNLENDIWQAFLDGAEEAADALGLEVDYQSHEGQESQQMSQIQSAITQGADVVTGTAYQDSGVRSLVEQGVENGVPFIEYWTMSKWYTPLDAGDEFVQYQIPEVYRTGAATARVLFEAMGGEGNFVHITGVPGHVGSHRNRGVEIAMEDYPDIERLGDPIPSDWTRQTGREAMSDFISQFGDDIDGVYGQNDGVALGAISVLQENDMNLPVVGYDGFQETVERIRDQDAGNEPWLAGCFAARPFWQGGWAVVKGYDWHNDWEPRVPERMMFGGGTMIIDDSLEQSTFDDLDVSFTTPDRYLEVAFSDGESPYDWELMSVAESGEDWDPQNLLTPIRKDDIEQLLWTEENRPNDYELPEEYDDAQLFDEVEQDYRNRFEGGANPYA